MLNAFPRLLYFEKGNIFTGDHEGMRMRMKAIPIGEKEKLLKAWVWPEPLCFEAFERRLAENPDAGQEMFTAEFPLSEEGRAAACDWVRGQFADNAPLWQAHYRKMKD